MTAKTNPMIKLIAAFALVYSTSIFSQITVDPSLTTQELVQDVLINGTCAETSNFQSSTGSDFGFANGIAAFDANGSDFPYSSGVVLTSGDVLQVPGPNTSLATGGGWPGDPDLEAFTTATNTNDASWIQFDFVPLTEQFSFNFIMASEEYNQLFECTFSDAFAFILTDQTTGVSENLAVLPGTTIPIEVTNIRPEVPGNCAAINEEFFDKYNYQPFNDPNAAAINFEGQIVSLTAMSDVIIGNPYTIKLVVADETDTVRNIAVFLEAGSFNIADTDLGDNLLISAGNAPCEGDTVILDATDPDASSYTWFFNNVVIPGETNPTLAVTMPGEYGVEVTLADLADCIIRDDITIEFINGDAVNLGDDIEVCEGGNETISPGILGLTTTYVWFLDGVEIPGETSASLEVSQAGIYTVEVTFAAGCSFSDQLEVTIATTPEVDLGDDFNDCLENPVTLDGSPSNIDPTTATYQWFLNGFPIAGATNATFDVTEEGTFTVEVTLGDCVGTDDIVVTQLNPDGTGCSPNDLCFDAETINCGDAITGTTLGSTSNGAPTGFCGTAPGSPGNWYSFIGTGNIVELATCSSNYDTKLQVFEGACDALVCVDGNDDSCGLQSEVEFLSTPGTEYFIYVFGFGSSQGDYELTVNCVCDFSVDAGADESLCDEASFEIVANLSGETTFNPTYLWNTGDTTPNLVVTTTGTYTVEVTTAGGCIESDSVFVELNDTPLLDLGADFETCFDTPVVLDGSPSNIDPSSASYQWFLDGVEQVGIDTAQFEIFDYGTYEVFVTIGVCTASDTITVIPREDLEVTLDSPFQTCPDMMNTITASTPETGVTYRWFLNGQEIIGQTASTLEFEIAANTVGAQVYTVMITKGDCVGETSTEVTLYAVGNCTISQGLSPDGTPGFNDTLDLRFLADRSGIESLRIFNRHGIQVFERENYTNEWIGQTDDNSELPTGTYFYVIDFSAPDQEYGQQATGWIYLNRAN